VTDYKSKIWILSFFSKNAETLEFGLSRFSRF